MLKKIFSNELVRGSFILFITINIANVLNFLFHFSMGRLLGPADYGILAVLMSLIYIYGAPSEAIQTIIAKYTARLNVKKDIRGIKFFMVKSLSKGIKISLILFVILDIFAIFLSFFLKINYMLILITNILILFFISVPIMRGVLQGRKKFALLGVSMIIESVFKLVLAIILVILGFKVFGALIGTLIGVLFGLTSLFYFNKNLIKEKEQKINFENIRMEGVPYFLTMLIILLIFSIDIILAKRFFSAEIAGQYAVLSMLGKIIFFGTVAISKAMFPISAEKQEREGDSKNIFNKSFLIVAILCFISVMLYWAIPGFIISILYGNQYIEIKDYLVYSGIALSFLSLSNLILIYGLATNRLKKAHYLWTFLLLEIILLSFFHSNLLEYFLALIFSNMVMFICSFFLIKNK